VTEKTPDERRPRWNEDEPEEGKAALSEDDPDVEGHGMPFGPERAGLRNEDDDEGTDGEGRQA
jgi:hypothetical protein